MRHLHVVAAAPLLAACAGAPATTLSPPPAPPATLATAPAAARPDPEPAGAREAVPGDAVDGARRPAVVRAGKIVVTGGLSQDVVSQHVRKALGRMRLCYEDGLGRSAQLEGRVSAGVVIDGKGTTRSAVDNGSEMPDAKVRDCVVKVLGGITYPAPPDGTGSNATIPIVLLPAQSF